MNRRRFFREHGCAAAQGYFYSEPVAADAMIRLLQRQIASAWQGRRGETCAEDR